MNRIGIIVKARLGLTQLPGKIMKKINSKPFLFYMIERLKLIKNIDVIVIATINSKNDEIIDFLDKNPFVKNVNNIIKQNEIR